MPAIASTSQSAYIGSCTGLCGTQLKRRRAATRPAACRARVEKGPAGLAAPASRCLQLAATIAVTTSVTISQPALAAVVPLSESTGENGVPALSLDSKPSAPAQGVTPILPQDTTQETLDSLLSEAMSFIKGVDLSWHPLPHTRAAPCQHDCCADTDPAFSRSACHGATADHRICIMSWPTEGAACA